MGTIGWTAALSVGAALVAGGPVMAASLPVTSGLIVHLDVDDVTTDGLDNVTQWSDQSGQGNHATQSDNTMQPTLVSAATPTGTDVIRFDSQNDATPEHLIIGANPADFDAAGMTWFVVFRAGIETNNRRMFTAAYGDVDPGPAVDVEAQAWGVITDVSTGPADNGLGYRSLGRTSTGGFNAASAGGGTPSAINDTDFFVGSSYVDTTTDEVFAMLTAADGAQYTDSNNLATLQLVDHLRLLIGAQTGNDLQLSTGGWAGDLAALVVYNRVLSAQELADVTESLRQTYLVPEPASLGLLALGGLALCARRKN